MGGFPKRERTVFVSLPRFSGEVLSRKRDIMLSNEVSLLLDINAFLSSAGIELETDIDELDIPSSEVQIGGPVSNVYTNRYVRYYLKNFKWIVNQDHLDRYETDDNLRQLTFNFIETSTDGREGFRLGETFYEYIPNEKGWALIIKIVDRENEKVIHLLFGCGANGTLGAVKRFISQYKQIYKKHKKRPYIGIFEVDGDGVGTQRDITWLKIQDYFNY